MKDFSKMQSTHEKLAIIIPAYKPGVNFLELVVDLIKNCQINIVVVNDGSGKGFDDVFTQVNEIEGVCVLQHNVNRGKGAALKTAFNYVLNNLSKINGVITVDADGQHLPEDVLNIQQTFLKTPTNLVLGCREFSKDIPLRNKIGNKVSIFAYKLLLGFKISDTQTGLRAVPKENMKDCLKIESCGYEFETEQLIGFARKYGSANISEVSIQTVYLEDNPSHFNPILDSMKIYFSLFRYTCSSLLTFLVDIIAFMLFYSLFGGVFESTMFARVVALWVQFFLLQKFVFHTDGGIKKFILYISYVAFAGVVSAQLQILLAKEIGSTVFLAKLLAEGVLFFINFAVIRQYILRKKQKDLG